MSADSDEAHSTFRAHAAGNALTVLFVFFCCANCGSDWSWFCCCQAGLPIGIANERQDCHSGSPSHAVLSDSTIFLALTRSM